MSKKIVLITYHVQTYTKWFLAVMTPRYIAFNLTKNWFGQTWAGMRNWYYMGSWNLKRWASCMSHFDVEHPYAFESNVWFICYTVSAFKTWQNTFSPPTCLANDPKITSVSILRLFFKIYKLSYITFQNLIISTWDFSWKSRL